MGRTIPNAASASIPELSIFATNILSTILYRKVISCAITAGIVNLNTRGSILPSPSLSVAFCIMGLSVEFISIYKEFFQLIRIWFTAKTTAHTISGMFAKTIPPNKKMQDGITESDSALSLPLRFPQIAQNIR